MTREAPQWQKLYDETWGVRLDHSLARPGDVVSVQRRDGTTSEVTLKLCLSEGPSWSLWRVLAPGELLPGTQPPKRVQARRPLIRRGGELHRLPVLSPEPPPHTDADAPGDMLGAAPEDQ